MPSNTFPLPAGMSHKASLLSTIHAWTSVAPLMAAVLAPFSILFDIPALTEPWFIHTDPNVLLDPNRANAIPDHPSSLALSAIGLGFNVFANALLIVRFSTSAQWWRIATRLSVVFWVSKVIIALANLCVFGLLDPGTRRGEGLWCAVVSLILCGLISFVLLCHWAFEFNKNRRDKGPTNEQLTVRIAGRHFMLNVTFFVIDLGLLALLSSRVEHWTYLQGIYFATLTYLTIGFGDFYPTHTATRVLLFVFALMGIAQLGNIVGMLVEFFSTRASEKRAASRMDYERHRQEEEESRPGATPNLDKEIEFLHKLGEKQEARTRAGQLGKSLAGLLVFWIVGAAIFSQLEGWAYGTGMYFCYVSFLTVGYGEFAPITPAGRVVFVLYSLIAVPVMASFAVQAVQQIFTAFAQRQYGKTKAKKGLEPDTRLGADVEQSKTRVEHHGRDRIIPHAELAEQWHADWERQVRRHKEEGFSEGDAQKLADKDNQADEQADRQLGERADEQADEQGTNGDPAVITKQAKEFDEDARLTERVLELALSLEWRARKLLIMHLDSSAAQIVLKADRNVQLREVRALVREMEKEQVGRGKDSADSDVDKPVEEEGEEGDAGTNTRADVLDGARSTTILRRVLGDDPDVIAFPAQEDERAILEEVRRYREDFAGLLAAGSRLMGLKGDERALFERRRVRRAGVT